MDKLTLFLVLTFTSMTNGAVPGAFFWKPRLGLDLSRTTEKADTAVKATKENIRNGLVVLIDGYQVGMSLLAIAHISQRFQSHPHLDLLQPHFYTNAYRWGLRHLSLVLPWMAGNAGSYSITHKVWRKRFEFMDWYIPRWMRYLFPHIPDAAWEREISDDRNFKKYAESPFSRYHRYPTKTFKNYESQESDESGRHYYSK